MLEHVIKLQGRSWNIAGRTGNLVEYSVSIRLIDMQCLKTLGFSPSGLYPLNLLCILDLSVVNHGSCSVLSPEIRLGCFKAARYRWDF